MLRLHPEVPLVPLLGLMHLGVALLGAILRRRWGGDDGRVHDRALPQPHALCRQVLRDLGQQVVAEAMPFQQVPEVQDRRLIGQRPPHRHPHEALDGRDLIERVLHRRVAEVVKQLHTVNPQHHRQRIRGTPVSPGGIDRAQAAAPAAATESSRPSAAESAPAGSGASCRRIPHRQMIAAAASRSLTWHPSPAMIGLAAAARLLQTIPRGFRTTVIRA